MSAATLTRAIVGAPWCAKAEADCARGGDVSPAVIDVRRDLPTAGLMRDGLRVGTLSWLQRGEEYFVALLAGGDGANRILAEFSPVIYDHARSLGCKVIRCTTERPGLVRRLTTEQGWEVAAVILQKNLNT